MNVAEAFKITASFQPPEHAPPVVMSTPDGEELDPQFIWGLLMIASAKLSGQLDAAETPEDFAAAVAEGESMYKAGTISENAIIAESQAVADELVDDPSLADDMTAAVAPAAAPPDGPGDFETWMTTLNRQRPR